MHLRVRSFLALAALLIFALHSLVPVGYMPDFSAKTPLSFMICDGTDHTHDMMHMDHAHMDHAMMQAMMDGMHHHDDKSSGHAKVCPFSVGGVYAANTISPPLIVPFSFALPIDRAIMAQALPRNVVFSTGSPRSPPLFS